MDFILHSFTSCANVYAKIKLACRILNSLGKGVISCHDDNAEDCSIMYCFEFFVLLETGTGKILFKIWPVRVDFIRVLQLSTFDMPCT